MSRGAVIFAINNGVIDYVSMAAWTARCLKRHLGIPVALLTDKSIHSKDFDHIITVPKYLGNGRYFADYDRAMPWHNQNRPDVYDLSPWDQTLMLDADYVVASPVLGVLFDSNRDFLAHRSAYDVTGLNDFRFLNYFGRNNMPMWWATVIYFRRSQTAEMIFNMMRMVRDHWQHYRDLYAVTRSDYRNDHAVSIALNTINGHIQPQGIPWDLASLTPDHSLKLIDQDHYEIEFADSHNRRRRIELYQQDFHAMGKRHLGEICAIPS